MTTEPDDQTPKLRILWTTTGVCQPLVSIGVKSGPDGDFSDLLTAIGEHIIAGRKRQGDKVELGLDAGELADVELEDEHPCPEDGPECEAHDFQGGLCGVCGMFEAEAAALAAAEYARPPGHPPGQPRGRGLSETGFRKAVEAGVAVWSAEQEPRGRTSTHAVDCGCATCEAGRVDDGAVAVCSS